ncbi:uncharacterized protein BT62DRAFT_988106 [Guyanagaster necrorhizus]|uniref:Fe2OG dioxygenase domain-containing protein n=1 Tax=Guyanagaster necrorhizus TaxID=856835 RepID=A0A9P7VP53_9AGAR|nr:uncharacterized protein BT62DRAFT_988106 [Guyanagaster necrorhizus MCA 3950]KAG7444042.1 hypothetical protein BT62DRAFT_988106 [Guyanagaster necrorhizus MCA 3950]
MHPEVKKIRSILEDVSFTSGSFKIKRERCLLYYRRSSEDSVARVINLAHPTGTELHSLAEACIPAPFGRNSEEVLDDNYRKALKLDTFLFATTLDLHMTEILDQIRVDLVEGHLSTENRIRPELYKLNIYGEGSFFKPHKDTPRSENMFGSLVIVFPTSHQGGGLALRSHGKEWIFDVSSLLANSTAEVPRIAYAAFYSDVEHEVLPVTSGSRVTLTYNLYREHDTHTQGTFIDTGNHITTSELKQSIAKLIADPSFLPRGGKLGFGLRHQYPLKANGGKFEVADVLDLLKGSDASLYGACDSLSLPVDVRISYMPKGDEKRRYLTDSEFYHFTLYDESLSLWMRQEGVESVKEQEDWHDSRIHNSTRIFWVTPRTELSRVTTPFAYYGNEPDLGFLYGDICLVVDLIREGSSGEESEEEEVAESSSESEGLY